MSKPFQLMNDEELAAKVVELETLRDKMLMLDNGDNAIGLLQFFTEYINKVRSFRAEKIGK